MTSKVFISSEQSLLNLDFYNHFAHTHMEKTLEQNPLKLFSLIEKCLYDAQYLFIWVQNDPSSHLFSSLVDYAWEKVCNYL